uniref:Glucose-methanol-choline oxidoreductase N-terminal domain-containing protein n=1 Tax=Alexandrium monilatum TaxID=311494 RepID=A0A7S4W663_9DINO
MDFLAGKVLGGTSAVNGMVYGEGHPGDYPVPAEDVQAALEALGQPRLRRPHGLQRLPPVFRAIVDAFELARVPWLGTRGDFPIVNGVGFVARWAQRWSAYDQALGPQRNVSHLAGRTSGGGSIAVLTHTRVRRLLFGRGSRGQWPGIEAVEVVLDSNVTWQLPTPRLVLAAGAIGTPALLMASGVQRHCNATVGFDLQDHIGFRTLFSLKASCDDPDPHSEGAWTRSLVKGKGADIDLVAYLGKERPYAQIVLSPQCGIVGGERRLAFGVDVILLRGVTRGRIHQAELGAPGSGHDKRTRLEFPVAQQDVEALMRVFIFMRTQVFGSPALAKYPAEPHPIGRFPAADDHEGLYHHIMPRLQNFYHMAGTMHGAIDRRLRLPGCRGLRVADGSAFASPVVGHPDVPTRALGWLAARYLLEDEGLL